MIGATGVRLAWSELPLHVRTEVEAIVGGRVVEAVSQAGGFSPGSADRVRTAEGRRAFVKAVSPAQNADSPRMHRREAEVSAALPSQACAPRLLGSYDDGDWVALVLEDIDGRHPRLPWRDEELALVLRTLERSSSDLTPSPIPGLARAEDWLGDDFDGWERLAADTPGSLDPWAQRHLDRLVVLGGGARESLAGDTLVHADVRADNLLLTGAGRVVLVDWPWACNGSAWLDSALVIVNAVVCGHPDGDALLGAHPVTARADPWAVTALLAGFTGFLLDAGRHPPPPGLPTVRAFQQAQGEALLRWLVRRTGWH